MPDDPHVERPAQEVLEAERTRTLRRRVRSTLIVAAALAGVWMALLGGVRITAGPEVCRACHEIRPAVASWERSVHASVRCAECHVGAYGAAQLPRSLVEQTAFLTRDVIAKARGGYEDPVAMRSAAAEPTPDTVCLSCHRQDRTITPKPGIVIDHREHARRNGSCVSCHLLTAHPLPQRGSSLTLMTQCYSCHGTAEQPEASAECETCHPKEFDPRPGSHADTAWQTQHGKVKLADSEQCDMCHEQQYCNDCHGLPMPHPDTWLDARKGHSVFSADGGAACSRCHVGGTNVCTSCHHPRFDPAKGSWLDQHSTAPQVVGSARCVECHSPLFCSRCHAQRPPE